MAHSDASTNQGKPVLRLLRDIVVIVVSALIISFILKTFLIRSFYIPSGSMKDTLQINDRVMVNQLVPGIFDVKRGDVIVFKDPGGWLQGVTEQSPDPLHKALQYVGFMPDRSENFLIKRVIGVAGDRVICCNAKGNIEINGAEIVEPYLRMPAGEQRVSAIDFDVQVPEGSLWVMGDNRYESKDSRYNQELPSKGFVLTKEVVGKAFVINWPVQRIGPLSGYKDVFASVPTPGEAARGSAQNPAVAATE